MTPSRLIAALASAAALLLATAFALAALPGALGAVLAIPADEAPVKDILLVTDAEVWAVEQVLDRVAGSGHRLFVVVVGAAPAEALARKLAERTGGACEFVGPNEDAEAVIVRTFRRLREAPKRVARVEWGGATAWQGPLPAAVFSGDTLHLFAGFAGEPPAAARVVVAGADGRETVLEVRLPAPSIDAELPRIAAARRLAALPAKEAAALAERYQLASRFTSFVVVKVRADAEKAEGLPAGVKVPQMLAAGWGGVGSVRPQMVSDMVVTPSMAAPAMMERRAYVRDSAFDFELSEPVTLDSSGPSRSRRQLGSWSARDIPSSRPGCRSPREFLHVLAAQLAAGQSPPLDLDALVDAGVPEDITEVLRGMLEASGPVVDGEARLVRLWLALLALSPAGAVLTEDQRNAIKGNVLAGRDDRGWRKALRAVFVGITPEDWGNIIAAVAP